MRTDGPTSRWLDDVPLDEPRRRRSRHATPRRRTRILLAGAAVPWLVVGALLALPSPFGEPAGSEAARHAGANTAPPDASNGTLDGDDPGSHGPERHHPAGHGSPAGAATGTEAEADDERTAAHRPTAGPADPVPELDLLELRGDWRVEPGPEEAAALAVVVARSWLTGLDPPLPIEGIVGDGGRRYAEHLIVEAVERPAADATVVTVLAVVLEGGTDESELAAGVRRLAVPIVWHDQQPRPGGTPWELPAPSLAPQELETTSVDDADDEAAAMAALRAAGYREVELLGLSAREGGDLVVAEVRARAGNGTSIDGRPVWLRRHLDGFVVSGTTLAEEGNQ